MNLLYVYLADYILSVLLYFPTVLMKGKLNIVFKRQAQGHLANISYNFC